MTHLLPVHRGFAERWHRATWRVSDAFVENPWRFGRWLYKAFECATCGDIQTKAERVW